MEEKRNVLSIEHLSISFSRYERRFRRTNLNAIRDLSLTVGEGEMVAVVGASGSWIPLCGWENRSETANRTGRAGKRAWRYWGGTVWMRKRSGCSHFSSQGE